ncbi:P-type ATPase [Sesbania bispinosa]|nr:P-type ATPase [Sesbania bispinosa]
MFLPSFWYPVLEAKLRVAVLVSKAAFQFIQGAQLSDYKVPEEVKDAGFQICGDELGSIVEGHDVKKFRYHGGVNGVAEKLSTSITKGLSNDPDSLNRRQRIYGINKFTESAARSFWVFVWEALQDMTLMILGVCAFVSLIVGIATEGWPKGAHDGLGIVASILLVVFVTATSDYRQSLQFKDLDKEKKKISIQVTRNGYRQKMSIYELLPGDIVHLAIGDQVPADGLFVSGFSVLIDESSLTGESEPVVVNSENPFLLSGTKVQDGSCKMLITTVGMRTQWGKLMATLSEGGDDETPLQVKLNGVATIIGKIGLFFAVVTFSVLVQGLMMNDKALVRHLAACETMGSATTICSDKTGTLTTNHMTVVKTCICMNSKEVSNKTSSLCSELPESAVKLLLESIFNNTGGEVVVDKDGKREILGTPTETAIGIWLVIRMSVVVQLPGGGLRAHCKGASEIILAACDKVLNSNDPIPASGYTCIGVVGIKDPVRPGVKESVAVCRSAGITVRMVTDDGIAIEGPDFREKSQEELLELIPKIQVMARSSPLDKHTLVKHLRTTFGEVVAVTGDGTNDAPAFMKPTLDLQWALLELSADVIILDDNFSTIVTVAKWGRSVYINIQKFVQFQLTVNVVALIVNFTSACLTGTAPLTAVQLLWVNMIMDTLGALALATEPPNDDLMKRSPVGRKGNFISNVMWRNILGQSLYQFMVIWFLQSKGKSIFSLDGPDSDLVLNTLIFNSFVFCQVFNEINSREMEKIDVFKGILDNYVFVGVISATVFFQIIIVEYLGTFANTTPLTLAQWFFSLLVGFIGMPIAAQLKKIPVRST